MFISLVRHSRLREVKKVFIVKHSLYSQIWRDGVSPEVRDLDEVKSGIGTQLAHLPVVNSF